jgi:hypothetical protein
MRCTDEESLIKPNRLRKISKKDPLSLGKKNRAVKYLFELLDTILTDNPKNTHIVCSGLFRSMSLLTKKEISIGIQIFIKNGFLKSVEARELNPNTDVVLSLRNDGTQFINTKDYMTVIDGQYEIDTYVRCKGELLSFHSSRLFWWVHNWSRGEQSLDSIKKSICRYNQKPRIRHHPIIKFDRVVYLDPETTLYRFDTSVRAKELDELGEEYGYEYCETCKRYSYSPEDLTKHIYIIHKCYGEPAHTIERNGQKPCECPVCGEPGVRRHGRSKTHLKKECQMNTIKSVMREL